VIFSNRTSGAVLHRQFTLSIGQPLVQNGGFETGDFPPWILTADGSGNSSLIDDGSFFLVPYDGDFAAALSEFGSVAHLTQNLATVPGQAYLISYWLTDVDVFGFGTIPNEFIVSWNGSNLYKQFNLPDFDWTYYQFVVVANTNNSILDFGFRN